MNKGLFIAIDGPDGSGKSTIATELYQKLKNMDYDVVLTKEITSGPIGSLIKKNGFKDYILAELVAADRLYHIQHEVLPELNNKKIVISDRYIASSYVCQQLDGLSLEFIKQINSKVIQPDLSIFVLAEQSVILERLSARDKLERLEQVEYIPDMIRLYKEAINEYDKNNYGRVLTVNNNTKEDFTKNINTILNEIQLLGAVK